MEEAECDQSNKNADARSTAAIALQPAYAQSGKDSANARAGEKSGMASSSGETPDRGKTLRAAADALGMVRWSDIGAGGSRLRRWTWSTPWKFLAAAQRSARAMAGVAHEVRNPLAGIRSTAQLWQRGDRARRGVARRPVHEVDRLEEIVSRLLQFSRADAQDLAPGDLNAVLAEAARLARGPAECRACGSRSTSIRHSRRWRWPRRPCCRSSAT